MTDPYSETRKAPTLFEFQLEAEVKLADWSESKRGAFIRLELPPIPVGDAHPFKGLEGQRFRMRFTPLIGDATLADAVANEAPAPADAPPFIGARTASVEGTPDAVPGRGRRVSEVPALDGDCTFPPSNAAAAVPMTSAEGPGHRSEAARERYRTMDKMAQACVRSGRLARSPRFDAWLKDAAGLGNDPAQFIRDWCGVTSRTEIASNAAAYERFRDLEHEVRGHAEER